MALITAWITLFMAVVSTGYLIYLNQWPMAISAALGGLVLFTLFKALDDITSLLDAIRRKPPH